MPVDGAGPLTGTLLQRRYRVAARIASGGMGTVFAGHDERLDRDVAIKVLHAHLAEDEEVRTRFRDEARHAAKVRHHNVVAVLDQDEHDELPFIVMELVDGPSLRELLRDKTRLSPDELVGFLTEVCAGLTAVHGVGLIHRDIKPENLLHDRRGDVRVADFGIARALDSTRLTPAGTLLGSVQYMAPEVVLGKPATFASDQYSLGVVAFESITGQPPLPADVPLAAALRHAREVVPPPSSVWPNITPALDRVITTAAAKDPSARYPTLDAFLTALGEAVHTDAAADRRRDRTDIMSTPHDATLPPSPARGAGAPSRRGLRTRRAAARESAPPSPAAPPGDVEPLSLELPATPGRRQLPDRPPSTDRKTTPAPAVPPQQPVYVRARMSAMAIVALAFTLVQSGAVVSPLLGLVALRRIDRSHGALRGEAIAALAIVIGLARLAVVVLRQF